MNDEQTKEQETILVAMSRAGAETLAAAAEVGLDNDFPRDATDGFDFAAGDAALRDLREALAGNDDEVARKGVAALETFFSHDRDLIILDSDGVGLMDPATYRDLYEFLEALRGVPPALGSRSVASEEAHDG